MTKDSKPWDSTVALIYSLVSILVPYKFIGFSSFLFMGFLVLTLPWFFWLCLFFLILRFSQPRVFSQVLGFPRSGFFPGFQDFPTLRLSSGSGISLSPWLSLGSGISSTLRLSLGSGIPLGLTFPRFWNFPGFRDFPGSLTFRELWDFPGFDFSPNLTFHSFHDFLGFWDFSSAFVTSTGFGISPSFDFSLASIASLGFKISPLLEVFRDSLSFSSKPGLRLFLVLRIFPLLELLQDSPGLDFDFSWVPRFLPNSNSSRIPRAFSSGTKY